jgi:hypothetical protein
MGGIMNLANAAFFGLLFSLVKIFLLVIVILAIMVLAKRSHTRIKGVAGERRVRKILARLPEPYKVINDLLLETERGTSQIDHTVLSPHGIFVLETKNYGGWIFGDEHAEYWTQVIYNTKNSFYNPVRQNYGHVQALKEVLGSPSDVPYYPVVLFNDGCTLKKVNSVHPVIYEKQLMDLILDQKREVALTGREIDRMYATLLAAHCHGKEMRKQHIEDIRARKAHTASAA